MKTLITFPKAITLAQFREEAKKHGVTMQVKENLVRGRRGEEPIRYFVKEDGIERAIIPNWIKDDDTLEPITLAQWARTFGIPGHEILIENAFQREIKPPKRKK